MILAHLSQIAVHSATLSFFQEQAAVGFSPLDLWHNMGNLAKGVVIILFIMSIWSLAVIIDRALYFSAAKKQSREFAPRVAGALKEGKLDEAIKVADRNKKSHLAEVVTAGLQEFRNYGSGGAITEEQIESSQRALERSEAIVHAKLKRGLGGLATIGSTSPFIGLFGTVVGILNAFQQIATQKTSGNRRSRRRHLGSAGHHRFRVAGRDSRGYDLQLLHWKSRSFRRGDGQLLERTDRLFHQAVEALVWKL